MTVVGFTCSTFDLFHAGHVLMLKDAKSQCDRLIVGLQRDPTQDLDYRVKTNDGKNKNTPIQSFEERKIQVEGCKYVDEIVEYTTEQDLLDLLRRLKPDVRVLGSDWQNKPFTGHNLPDSLYYFHQRDHPYSSSALRRRVHEAEANR